MKRILAVAAGLFILVGGLTVLGIGPFSATSQLCTTGVDEVRVESNVLEFSGDDAWFIDASLGCDNKVFGGGGTIPSEDIVADDASAIQDFTLGVNQFDAWFYQDIRDDRIPVYEVRSATYEFEFFGGNDAQEQACDEFQAGTPSSGNAETRIYKGSTLYCFRTEKVGSISDWSLAQGSSFNAEVYASAAGRTSTDTISKQDAVASVNVGDVNDDGDSEQARITWTGSLIGELRSIDLDGYRPACNNNCANPTSSIEWIVGDEQNYRSWQDYNNNGFQQCIEAETDPSTCTGPYNSLSQNVFLDASGDIENQAGFNVEEVRTKDGQIQVVAQKSSAVERPDFRILVDADWIGFELPVGKPAFTSVPDNLNVQAGTTGSYQVGVRNFGPDARIQVTSQCQQPVGDDSYSQMIPEGEERVYQLDLPVEQAETQDVTCTVTAQDTDDTSTAVSTDFTVSVQSSCTDADGDGVCDQFDQCPETPGTASNNGCPEKEVCGDGVDNDGDGVIDENCDDTGGLFGGFPDIGGAVGGFLNDLGQAVSNPFQDVFLLFDVLVTLILAVAAVVFVSTTGLDLLPTTAFATLLPVSEGTFRISTGLIVGILVGVLAYSLISSIVVKFLLIAGLAAAVYIKGLIPGV